MSRSLGRVGGRRRARPEMNVTPLVDVVLVLLILFMVVIPAMEGSLDLEVPAVTQPDEEERGPEPVELALSRGGTLMLDLRPVREEHLESSLRAAHAARPSSRLVLKGDREVPYARVRALYAMAARVGFTGVSLQVSHRQADRREAAPAESAQRAPSHDVANVLASAGPAPAAGSGEE